MKKCIPGKELSRGLFEQAAQPLLERYFPDLRYSAGLLGYGSDVLGEHLPYTYKGYSVHFTEPDENDNGVRHPLLITEGPVSPLIFIMTWPEFLRSQLGTAELDSLTAAA